jgi:hypothetical protein
MPAKPPSPRSPAQGQAPRGRPPPAPSPARLEGEANDVALRVALGRGPGAGSPSRAAVAGQARRELEEAPAAAPSGDGGMRAQVGRALGRDLSAVRLHTGDDAARRTSAAGALAETSGGDVWFAPGRFRPDLPLGRALIAHELAHAAQFGAPVVPGREEDAIPVTPAPSGTLSLYACFGGSGSGDKDQEAPAQASSTGDAGTATGDGGTGSSSPPPPPPPPSVANVKSLEIGRYEANARSSFGGLVKTKSDQRDEQIAETKKLVKAGTDEMKALDRMGARFATVHAALGDAKFDAATSALPFAGTLDSELAADQADAKVLAGKKFRFLVGAVGEFRSAIKAFVTTRRKLDEERIEFKRFDEVFVGATTSADPKVKAAAESAAKLLAQLKPLGIEASDVKALMAVETGDFTNTQIAGITGKSKGITTSDDSAASGVVGMAQIRPDAKSEAVKWASAAGVNIEGSDPPKGSKSKAKTDPRLEALPSILLAMAYMGQVANILQKGLPSPQPTGAEFKKFVYAGYVQPYSVTAAARAYMDGKGAKTAYTWDDIRNSEKVTTQMRNYVERVNQRLAP